MVIYQKMKIAISHFPGKVKKKHEGKWQADQYFVVISTIYIKSEFHM
jgi:hypothetical protein